MAYSGAHEELLELAFQLAYFIHRDKAVALLIATAALEKLDAADSRQDKRRYYNPSGQRRKVSLPELLLLQRLVYAESEPHEKRKEQTTPNQAMMVKHFIKHLVKITSRRNSFHVTLGLARLLHDYTATETAELYNLVRQDPARLPEDGYYRSRKAVLMAELKDRFGQLLGVERLARGQERFQPQTDSRHFAQLVRECLHAFMPWQTRCGVPERFDPATEELDALAFRGNDPDEGHQAEVNRYHAVLHPLCFARLVLALGYDAPETRLLIPQFLLASATQDDDGDGSGTSASLSEEDRNSVRQYLSSQTGRRQASTAGLLQFVVDGELLGTLDPQQTSETRFAVSSSAEFIEIHTPDGTGDLLLAVQPLALDAHGDLAEQQLEFELADGRGVRLSVTPTHDANGLVSGATVRAAAPGSGFGLSPTSTQAEARSTVFDRLFSGWLKPAVAFAVLALLAAVTVYVLRERATPKPPVITEASPTLSPGVSPNVAPLLAGASPTPAPTRKPTPRADDVVAFNLPSNPLLPGENLRRVEREEEVVTSLLAGQKLFVDAKGAPGLLESFVAALKAQLQADGTFHFTDNRDEADIALKLNVEAGTQGVRVVAAIVNAKGEVLWPLTLGVRARRYDGISENVIAELSRELLRDFRQLKQK